MKLWKRLLLGGIAALLLTAVAFADGNPWPCPVKVCPPPTAFVR
jgi:hypothetical protein